MLERTKQWLHFSDQVDRHIIHYCQPQYNNDFGNEQVDEFSVEQVRSQLQRYISRMGSSVRGPQEALRDCLKIAHYAQFAYDKLKLLHQIDDIYKDEEQLAEEE